MSDPAPVPMTSADFIAWAMKQPEGQRYELFAGRVVAMAPERSAHALAKGHVFRRLAEAVERDGLERADRKRSARSSTLFCEQLYQPDCSSQADVALACTVYPDGMAVVINETTTCEPDALVRCGPAVPPDTITLSDPVIIVEVLSPSTRARDHGDKLIDYFRLSSVRHYLIVRTEDKAIIHHARNEDGTILTRIIREGVLSLDPPGLRVAGLFEE